MINHVQTLQIENIFRPDITGEQNKFETRISVKKNEKIEKLIYT